MRGDKRKTKRHRMTRDAWVTLEDGTRSKCTWSNISGGGACITVPDAEGIPNSFVMLLSENGSARRRCRVIWRKPQELGIKFETQLDERLRAALGKKPGASTEATEPAESDA
ncbi:MAG TPA: PilZ domain-containing protein [Pseudolabrys sp.]|nr:PilZ domain-containing protein [Pseudolabrys sp.]